MEEKLQLKTNDLAWNNFEQSLESLLRDRRQPEPSAGSSTEPPPPPSPCSTLSDQLPTLSPSNHMAGNQVNPRPIPTIRTMSLAGITMQTNYSTSLPQTIPGPSPCQLCPSPSPFVATDRSSREIHLASHQHVKFVCAACGHRLVEYEEMVKHVETEHVGDDEELVRASIIIPDNIHLLKTFQCGLKTCGRKLIGLTELDLKEHIRRNHGEFYIRMGQGRNLVRMCRLCPGARYVSDQALTEHVQQAHPLGIFANEESRDILPAMTPSRSSYLDHVEEVRDHDHGQVIAEEEPVRERLDVWYFRDQNENMVRGGEEHQRKDLSGGMIMSESRVMPMPGGYSNNDEGESRREKYDRHKKSGQVETENRQRRQDNLERFSISPLEPGDERKPIDLNYKLKNIREAKKVKMTKVFCRACNSLTLDWENHKHGLKHAQNNKKARCMYCPKRVWFYKLKAHVQTRHKGCSFSCNVTSNCLVRLMDLDKLTDHINKKHSDQVDRLRQQFCKNSELKFVSSFYLGKSNLFLLPTDLRKLTCKLCGLKCLGQDQAALTEHFQLEHSGLSSHSYSGSILYECRACESMLFGSQDYLLEHFQEVHSMAGLSINRESPGEGGRKERSYKTNNYYESSIGLAPSLNNSVRGDEYSRTNNNATYSQGRRRDSEDPIGRKTEVTYYGDDGHGHRYYNEKGREFGRSCADEPSNERKRRYSESSLTRAPRSQESMMKYKKQSQEPGFQARKRLNSEVALPHDEYYYQSDEDIVVSCPFCDKKCLHSRLLAHMKKKHKENLFSCDGSCDKRYKSAWKSEVLTHLKTVHILDMSDSILYRHYLKLPTSNAMISCRMADCVDAIFLSRSVGQVEKMMTRHSEKYHKGQPAGDWFSLACRSCNCVFKTVESAEWEKHLMMDHRRKNPKVKRSSKSDVDSTTESGSGSVDDDQVVLDDINEGRLVRLVSDPTYVCQSTAQHPVCKFCGEIIEEEERAVHVQAVHLTKLFNCSKCHEGANTWVAQTASELVSHLKQDHKIDIKFEDIPPPEDQDNTLSICTVCQSQFYTCDPSILATHLLDHGLGPDLKQILTCCRICNSVKGSTSPIKDVEVHTKQVHDIASKEASAIKVEEVQEDAITTATKSIHKFLTEVTKSEDAGYCQPCPFCGDLLLLVEISKHISTQHSQSAFHCSICQEGNAPTSITMFDKLDKAMVHMTTEHKLDLLPALIANARAVSTPTSSCPVLSCLSQHYPDLKLPGAALTQVFCAQCKATVLQVDFSDQHCDSCHSKQLDSQCKLCLVTLPGTTASTTHFM